MKGFVTDAMQEGVYALACGPKPMLQAVLNKAGDCQFSFEERMGCGFGACMGCTCQTNDGPKRVCKDGPVFKKEAIVAW
jgi:dihydroorotate dehydrogenase electron transfer subunit